MTNKGYVRTANSADIPIVAQDMRDADVAEVQAYSGHTPEQALENGLTYPGGTTRSLCLPTGVPVGMFGVVPTDQPKVGVIWMLASKGITQIQRYFLRESRGEINGLIRGYDLVFNFTDARNTTHHRWIKWAGFTILKKHQNFGKEQLPFLEFACIVEKQEYV
jgi:hypothetical protein